METITEERLEAAVESGGEGERGKQRVVAGDEDALDDAFVVAADFGFGGVQPSFAGALAEVAGPTQGAAGGGVFEEAERGGAGDGEDGGVRTGDPAVQRGTFEGRDNDQAPADIGNFGGAGDRSGGEQREKSALAAAAWSGSGHGR